MRGPGATPQQCSLVEAAANLQPSHGVQAVVGCREAGTWACSASSFPLHAGAAAVLAAPYTCCTLSRRLPPAPLPSLPPPSTFG